MNFKVPKGQVISDAQIAAMNAVQGQLSNLRYSQIENLSSSIGNMMVFAIDAAIVSVVNNIYTDEEFEKDLTLRP